MLKIRLKRIGKKNAPSYRIVVADARSPRNGRVVEELGWYNPAEDPSRVKYNKERLEYWTNCGAQMTSAVEKLVKGEYQYIPYAGSEEQEKKKGAEAKKTRTEETEAVEKAENREPEDSSEEKVEKSHEEEAGEENN